MQRYAHVRCEMSSISYSLMLRCYRFIVLFFWPVFKKIEDDMQLFTRLMEIKGALFVSLVIFVIYY